MFIFKISFLGIYIIAMQCIGMTAQATIHYWFQKFQQLLGGFEKCVLKDQQGKPKPTKMDEFLENFILVGIGFSNFVHQPCQRCKKQQIWQIYICAIFPR